MSERESLMEALRKALNQSGKLLILGLVFSFTSLLMMLGAVTDTVPLDLKFITFTLSPQYAFRFSVFLAIGSGWGSHLLFRRAIRVMRRLEFDLRASWPDIESVVIGSSYIRTNYWLASMANMAAALVLSVPVMIVLSPSAPMTLTLFVKSSVISGAFIFTLPYWLGWLMPGLSFFSQKPFWFRGLGLMGHKEFADFEFQWLMRMSRRLGPLRLLIKLWREPEDLLVLDERDFPWWYQPKAGQIIIYLLEEVERDVGYDKGGSLRGALETARYSSEAGLNSDAIASLQLFIKQVREMIDQNALKAEVGEMLVDLAQKAIKQLTRPGIAEDTSSSLDL